METCILFPFWFHAATCSQTNGFGNDVLIFIFIDVRNAEKSHFLMFGADRTSEVRSRLHLLAHVALEMLIERCKIDFGSRFEIRIGRQ